MKLKEFLLHMLMFGNEKRTHKAHKEKGQVFLSTHNIDPKLFGQKERLHLSIPVGPGISRIAVSGGGVGIGGTQKTPPSCQG